MIGGAVAVTPARCGFCAECEGNFKGNALELRRLKISKYGPSTGVGYTGRGTMW